MTYQTQWNQYIAYKVQSALNTAASGSGATVLPWTSGRGQGSTQAVQSRQIRRDGMAVRGRHGARRAQGSYPGEMQLANYDPIIEAVMRGTWGASVVTISNGTSGFTSATIAVSGSVVTVSAAATGASLLTVSGGPKVGDVVVWASGVDAADRDRPLRLTGMTANTMTFAESLTTVAGPESTWAFDVPKKLINPPVGSLVKRYFTIEEHEIDLDGSEIFEDAMWGQLEFSMQPNGMFMITPSWTGTGTMSVVSGGSAPYFTSPADPAAAVPIAAIDATIRFGSGDLVDLTAFNLTVGIGLSTTDVISSGTNAAAVTGTVSPDVFDGVMSVNASFTALRADLQRVSDALAETQLSASVLLRPEGSTTDWFSIHLPNFTIPQPDKSEASREGGPRTQTINVPAELVGVDDRGGAYDATMVKFQRSNV